jgi:Protein of unknown function (DUF1553)/Protein of unknown function (DUF1549)/Planctomycete cytochrome C
MAIKSVTEPAMIRRSGCHRARGIAILGLVLALTSPARAMDEKGARDHFETKVRPILVEHCYPCHSVEAAKSKGGLKLDSRDGLRVGGDSGPAVVPGKPAESLLLGAIEHADGVEPMPPKAKLPDPVIADIRRWIELGATDPRDTPTRPAASTKDRWALRAVARPSLPEDSGGWVRNPIDAFVLAKLRESKLGPSPEADRRTLIRRLTFDLIGLPPSPEEVEAFLADPAPDAYERLVDRLLASPHRGERWARRWMDLVHFAETHGHDQDRVRPNAWPYRDYLIESFNVDKPYARFVQEQIAADVLFPDDPSSTVGLGFLAAGPWDESSLRDIREDSIDRQVGYYLDRDDMVTTVMSTFTSSTVHCARCHDHKFDPITTEEYYGLQAVFAGVGRADRAYDPDPKTARLRLDLTARRKALLARDPALLESLLGEETQAEVESWAASLQASRISWTVLDPSSMKSANGSTLEKLPDGSILAGRSRPAEETYIITASTDLGKITAARLELIPDARLPSQGPGRNENGNLHLTEFQVLAAPRSTPEASKSAPIARAMADFDQAGWGIAGSIDGNPMTAWGIYPQVGKPHEGVFEFANDVGHDGGTILTFALRQTYPAGHPIGRFRLSVTTSPRPVRTGSLPSPLAGLVDVPAGSRSREQRQELASIYLLGKLDGQLASLPAPRLVYAAASQFAPDGTHKPTDRPRPVFVLKRGDIRQPGTEAVPGALGSVEGLSARFGGPDEGPRRAALARWIVDKKNPLTWRSIVNRAWLVHFGRGLVDTPNDFGRMGSLPSHPELLDWLASEFLEDGSLRRLDRLIVTSATYRQSSRHDPKASAVDADNRLLWRMNRSRLDADSIRDAVLSVSGRLDRTMGGPSIQHFTLGPGVHVTPTVDYRKFDWDAPGAGRRSVYRFAFRTLPDPFMEQFDAADASQLTPVRNASITPLQALAMLNDPFILRQSEHFARRLEGLGVDREGQVSAAFALALDRPPEPDEAREWLDYATRHGLVNFARMLLNSNEFLFIN